MTQETHFVNCPGCGTILEVVCPMHDRKVKEVKAVKRRPLPPAYTATGTACAKCKMKLRIYWDFD